MALYDKKKKKTVQVKLRIFSYKLKNSNIRERQSRGVENWKHK